MSCTLLDKPLPRLSIQSMEALTSMSAISRSQSVRISNVGHQRSSSLHNLQRQRSGSISSANHQRASSLNKLHRSTTVYIPSGAPPVVRRSVQRAPPPPPPPPAYDLLDWVLFFPSPVSASFVGLLAIEDLISLSQVCRSFRCHLIPTFRYGKHSHRMSNLEREWHPLVKSVVANTSVSERPAHSAWREMTPYAHYLEEQKTNRSGFDIFRLIKVFRNEYFNAITTIDLDGLKLNKYTSNLKWVHLCTNLEKLSIRSCSGVTVKDLATVLLHTEERKKKSKKSDDRVFVPQKHSQVSAKLQTVLFWGVHGTQRLAFSHNEMEDVSSREILEEQCYTLMMTYKTDLRWCAGKRSVTDSERFSRKKTPQYMVLYSTMESCSICKKISAAQCRACDSGSTCERCLGFVCNDCLVPRMIPHTPANQRLGKNFSKPVNMLMVNCGHSDTCATNNAPHHIHPGCLPQEMLIWGQGDNIASPIFGLFAYEFYRNTPKVQDVGTPWRPAVESDGLRRMSLFGERRRAVDTDTMDINIRRSRTTASQDKRWAMDTATLALNLRKMRNKE
ncbi:hypothetical protein H072_5174 [Dactylellina haptotyla CBS 200.50]|uniref:F-box domain-containing protein n=1 Tax=Dactylellina haptotyla (strain CBS 200.50) TaxID=1284197 RepID=S8ADA7_DACHA|nr:hypothetical protein H072_5174 [Dactylellina haptotyla CBS 200.50]